MCVRVEAWRIMITHFWRRVAEERRTLATWSEKEKAPTITNTQMHVSVTVEKGGCTKWPFLYYFVHVCTQNTAFFSVFYSLLFYCNMNPFYFHNVTFFIFEKIYNYVYLGIDWIVKKMCRMEPDWRRVCLFKVFLKEN